MRIRLIKQRTAIFVILSISFCILRMLYMHLWLRGMDDWSEAVRVISILDFIVLAVLGICMFIREIKLKKYLAAGGCLLGILILAVGIYKTKDIGLDYTTVTHITDKSVTADKKYIEIKNIENGTLIELECSDKTYDKVQSGRDNLYTLNYKCLKSDSTVGYLISAE